MFLGVLRGAVGETRSAIVVIGVLVHATDTLLGPTLRTHVLQMGRVLVISIQLSQVEVVLLLHVLVHEFFFRFILIWDTLVLLLLVRDEQGRLLPIA